MMKKLLVLFFCSIFSFCLEASLSRTVSNDDLDRHMNNDLIQRHEEEGKSVSGTPELAPFIITYQLFEKYMHDKSFNIQGFLEDAWQLNSKACFDRNMSKEEFHNYVIFLIHNHQENQTSSNLG